MEGKARGSCDKSCSVVADLGICRRSPIYQSGWASFLGSAVAIPLRMTSGISQGRT